MRSMRLGLFCCFFALATAQDFRSANPRVTTDKGTLSGAPFGSAAGEVMFLGIPFAAPPTGDLRWRPPQPVASWQGIRDASAFAPACPQPADSDEYFKSIQPELVRTVEPYFTYRSSEDCLYLNVWTASLPAHPTARPNLPVMFWIHGGGNITGTGQYPPLGPTLARKGVVLVSINYRLGALGFMAHPALTLESPHAASGNYAILDQIAALEWVRRNIARFGGDPANVTILGESAGAVMVCYLMASPLARGLFQRAILQSCSCADYISPILRAPSDYYNGHGSAEDAGRRLARDLGANSLAQLRAKTTHEILAASDGDPDLNFDAGGVVDGWVLREQPAVTFARGRQANVPVLAGSNSDEATVSVDEELHGPATLANYRAYVERHFAGDAGRVLHVYPAASDSQARAAFIALATDFLYGNSVRSLVRDTVRAGHRAWLYYFSYPARGSYAGLGAFHSLELAFVAGWLRPSKWGETTAEDRLVAERLAGYWVQFAKTGDPNSTLLPRWPEYKAGSDLAFEMGPAWKVRPVPHADRFPVFQRSLRKQLAALPKKPAS